MKDGREDGTGQKTGGGVGVRRERQDSGTGIHRLCVQPTIAHVVRHAVCCAAWPVCLILT